MQKKISKYILLAAFAGFIVLIWPLWGILKGHLGPETNENREKAKRPTIGETEYGEMPKAFEAYLNDRLPFRDKFIRLNSLIDYYVFKKSPNDNVILGKKDWLFLNDEADGHPVQSYLGEDLYTIEELQTIENNLVMTRDALAKRGCEFVLFIAPNKERVYSEYMPDIYGSPAEDYGAKQLVNYLREQTDLRVVYCYDDIMETKELLSGKCDIYHRYDTHWNNLGGYAGAVSLLKELGIYIPKITEVEISPVENKTGDLADQINVPSLKDKECDYCLKGFGEEELLEKNWTFLGTATFKSNGSDSRRLFIRRDSFCTAMADVIAGQFENSTMVHELYFNTEMLDEADPDVFVLETVERYTMKLLSFYIES